FAFRQQDVVEPRTGFDDLDDVSAAPDRAKSVDANGNAALAPVELIEGGNRVLPRLRLQGGNHRIFEIEEDGVGRALGGLFHETRGGSGHREQRSVSGSGGHEYLMFGLVTASSATCLRVAPLPRWLCGSMPSSVAISRDRATVLSGSIPV